MTEPLRPTGFWSYTRDDDALSLGRLSQLRENLTRELQGQLGRRFIVRIFQDATAIPKGADWDHEIGKALSQSSFFIPIVTPAFVQSKFCCMELMRFRELEESRGRNDLIFPLHYIGTKHLHPDRDGDSYDPDALRLLRARQDFQFEDLRHDDPTRKEVLSRMSALAIAIRDALYRDPPAPELRGLSLTGGLSAEERARREAEAREAAEAQRRDEAVRAQEKERAAAEERRAADATRAEEVEREAAARRLADRQAEEQREAARIAEERRAVEAARAEEVEREEAARIAKEQRVAAEARVAAVLLAEQQARDADATAMAPRTNPRRGLTGWAGGAAFVAGLAGLGYLLLPGETPKPPPAAATPARPPTTTPVVVAPSPTQVVPPAKPLEIPREFAAPAFDNGTRDCPTCPRLVLLPPGQFRMGVPPDESAREDALVKGNFFKGWDKNAKPHPVIVRRPFYMGETPVTVGQYKACVVAGGCKAADKPSFAQDDDHPQVNVSHTDAKDYVVWLNKPFKDVRYRLPSEAEWEYGARAVTTLSQESPARYWGESFNDKFTLPVTATGTVPVKNGYEPNKFGLYNMLGHVWQWTEDCWIDNYDNDQPSTDAPRNTTGSCGLRVYRGGSWNGNPRSARAGDRGRGDEDRACSLGFRVARTY